MVTLFNRRYSGRVSRPVGTFEMKVFDDDKKLIDIVPCYKVREDKSVIELDVDQFSGQPFMLNANGFITNDIMMFEECQSDSVARAVLQRLKVMHPESIDQNLTLDQMMALCVPSNYGSPAEFVSAHSQMASKMYKLYQADVAKYQAAQAAQAARAVAADAAAASDMSKSVPNPE